MKPLSTEATDIYLTALGKIYRAQGATGVDRALWHCLDNGKFFPSISELRDAAGMNQEKQHHAEAEQAWTVVMRWIDKYGSSWLAAGEPLPKLPERMNDALRAIGGMRAVEETDIQDLHFKKKQFIERYESQDYIDRYPLALPDTLRHLLESAKSFPALPARTAELTPAPAIKSAPRFSGLQGPQTDEMLAASKLRALEVAKKYTEQPS